MFTDGDNDIGIFVWYRYTPAITMVTFHFIILLEILSFLFVYFLHDMLKDMIHVDSESVSSKKTKNYVIIIFSPQMWLIVYDILSSKIFLLLKLSCFAGLLESAAIVLLVGGAAILIIGFLGCCGAMKQSQCLLCLVCICT